MSNPNNLKTPGGGTIKHVTSTTFNLPQTQQSAAGQQRRKYVFRLLGSVYEEAAGESEARPTVVEIPVYADNAEEAQEAVSEALAKFVYEDKTAREELEREQKLLQSQLESILNQKQNQYDYGSWQTYASNDFKLKRNRYLDPLNIDKDEPMIDYIQDAYPELFELLEKSNKEKK